MFATSSCEPTLPKSIHSKKREAASIVNQLPTVDTTTLINNTSTITLESPTTLQEDDNSSSSRKRLSSTIMTAGSIATTADTNKNNAMTTTIPSNSNNTNSKSATTTETTTKTPQPQLETIISIKNRVPVKSIRIERDYSLGDGITRFNTEYPIELEGKILPEEFNHTITEINRLTDYADRLSLRIVLENILETLTIYTWPILFSTHYQRAVTKLLKFIEKENSTIYYPHSLSISDPVKAAFLFIEINFYE